MTKYPPRNSPPGTCTLTVIHCPTELRDKLRIEAMGRGEHLWETCLIELAGAVAFELPEAVTARFKQKP